jgi:serine/threonine protein phosphatase PrpC
LENQLKIYLKDHDFAGAYPDQEIIYPCIRESFAMANKEVITALPDVRFSGSTCVSILTYGKKIFIANVGDSRAIVARAVNGSAEISADALSNDHKPDEPSEAKVILANNGRIDSYRDQNGNPLGPLRVWLKNEDIPGLAMTRSFGDQVAARVGVNAIPEMGEMDLNKDDKFIVLASDGIWEFLKNIDVARIIHPFYLKKNAEGAAESLVREAFKRWKKEEDVIDDITCIVIFLDVKV